MVEGYASQWRQPSDVRLPGRPLIDVLFEDESKTKDNTCPACKGRGSFRGGYVKCDTKGIHDERWEMICKVCKGSGRVPA